MIFLKKSEKGINELKKKQLIEITPYDVTVLQKNISERFNHLEKVLNNCSPTIVGDIVAIVDMTSLDKNALAHEDIRRMIISFTNYDKYGLKNFRETYAKYTNYHFLKKVQNEIKEQQLDLPSELSYSNGDYSGGHLERPSDIGRDGASALAILLTKSWGVISDNTKWRKGRLKENLEVKKKILSALRPLDLLFEKRKYTLSNLTIPGHWGHVAIWLGTKEQLIELGIWDQEFFKPFQEKILAGQSIVEVRKEGFKFESLDNFINLDDIAVTRMIGIKERATETYNEIFEQMDKEYDFTFNAHTEDKITCAELVAFSYGDIKWPGLKALGQVALRPDDLAYLTVKDPSASEFILFYSGNAKGEVKEYDFDGWRQLFKKRI